MLTSAQLKPLKQVSISIDPEKTKERVSQIWKAQKNATKNDVVALAGCSKATVYRIFDTGSIHIRLAIAIGQVLNVSPYYLTGEADEPGEFSEALLLQILEQHGYKKLLAEIAPPTEEKPKRIYLTSFSGCSTSRANMNAATCQNANRLLRKSMAI